MQLTSKPSEGDEIGWMPTDGIIIFTCFLLLAIMCGGCGIEERDHWEKAQSEYTISAFENYLSHHPYGKFAAGARSRIESLYNERHPAFRDVKTVKILIRQSYRVHRSENLKKIDFDFEDMFRDIFHLADVAVLKPDANKYDAILKIRVKGRASGSYYQWRIVETPAWRIHPGMGKNVFFLYTGAELTGTIALEVPGTFASKKTFEANLAPQTEIFRRGVGAIPYTDPSDILETAIWTGSFVTKMWELLAEVYGPNFLINALKFEDSTLVSIEALGALAADDKISEVLSNLKDPRTIEPLIAIAKNSYNVDNVRKHAIEVLGEIKDRSATKPLIDLIRVRVDDPWTAGIVRESATALGKIGDPRAIEPLIDLMSTEGIATSEALKKITGEDLGTDYSKWRKWWTDNKEKYSQKE